MHNSRAIGRGYESANGFVVMKGTKISEKVTDSFLKRRHNTFLLREELMKQKIINNFIFTIDYEFNSPSMAASIVIGDNANGNLHWKRKNKNN